MEIDNESHTQHIDFYSKNKAPLNSSIENNEMP